MDVDLFLLARKQGEIVVAIEHREELLAILLAHYIHTDHQSGVDEVFSKVAVAVQVPSLPLLVATLDRKVTFGISRKAW